MPYIKINSDNTVTLAGEVLSSSMEEEGYVLYEGDIPKSLILTWDSDTSTIIADLSLDKQNKLEEIKKEFTVDYNTGSFSSPTLSKDVNVGRGHSQNVNSLIDHMIDSSLETVQFRIYDNSFISITLTQLQELKLELINYGMSLYQHKWDLEEQIEDAVTQEAIQAITW